MGVVVVDGARNDVEIEALGRPRLAEHIGGKARRGGIAQPFVNGQAIALGLRYLLAVLIEEKLVVETFRRVAAQHLDDAAGEFDGVDQVLAGHLVVDAERKPAQRPVGLPLALDAAAGDRCLVALAVRGVDIDDGAAGNVALDDGDLQHIAVDLRDRQEWRIGLTPLLAQAGQHDLHDLVVAGEHAQQRLVETAGSVVIGRGGELVGKAEAVEEGPQPRVVGGAEARILVAEGVRHAGERLAEEARHHLLVGDVGRYLAEAVHVVGEGEQAGRHLVARQQAEGGAHHGGAGDLAEGADMGQAGGAVAGLEQQRTTGRCARCARPACAPPRTARRARPARHRRRRDRGSAAGRATRQRL